MNVNQVMGVYGNVSYHFICLLLSLLKYNYILKFFLLQEYEELNLILLNQNFIKFPPQKINQNVFRHQTQNISCYAIVTYNLILLRKVLLIFIGVGHASLAWNPLYDIGYVWVNDYRIRSI